MKLEVHQLESTSCFIYNARAQIQKMTPWIIGLFCVPTLILSLASGENATSGTLAEKNETAAFDKLIAAVANFSNHRAGRGWGGERNAYGDRHSTYQAPSSGKYGSRIYGVKDSYSSDTGYQSGYGKSDYAAPSRGYMSDYQSDGYGGGGTGGGGYGGGRPGYGGGAAYPAYPVYPPPFYGGGNDDLLTLLLILKSREDKEAVRARQALLATSNDGNDVGDIAQFIPLLLPLLAFLPSLFGGSTMMPVG